MRRILLVILLLGISACCVVHAQKIIQGHIYGGLNRNSPVDSMRISTSSGSITYTDIHGIYMIKASEQNDTMFVSYQGRDIIHYPVSFISTPEKFDVYLNNPAFYDTTYYHELPQVQVQNRSFRKDSLMKREMYANVFDYTKPKFNPFSPVTSVANLFNKGYIHRQERYRKFAEGSEQYNYVDSRWTKSIVAKFTGIEDDSVLADFMQQYEPPYSKMKDMNELELYKYISDSFNAYQAKNPMKK
ncbi:MAG TPA: hypothetical protein VGB84_00885 [Arachidicoccus sp.]